MIQERLEALRTEMKKRDIAMYIVPTADFHESEYVGEHFKAREFITGFTGSAGTAVITMTQAGLWTDGRYFVQAEKQLEGTTIHLYKMGEDGVPAISEYITRTLEEGECLSFDGRVVNGKWGDELAQIVEQKHGRLYTEEDLIDLIWENRPSLSRESVWLLDQKVSGRSIAEKLAAVRRKMEEERASLHILSSLVDIAWLLNVRGNDISYVPVVLSYLLLSADSCIWFLQEETLEDELRAELEKNGIVTRPYESFYDTVKTLEKQTILLNRSVVNYRICSAIPASNTIVDRPDPTAAMKAAKNWIEIDHIRQAHVRDAVAMCKFMYWLKKNVGKIPMTELSVSEHLEKLRAEQDGFLDLSFETICGYQEHGAIVHYAATLETDAALEAKGFLLVDSGGHYLEGTTDITRTFVLGPVTDEMKEDYTRVCRANLNLANTRFLHGCTGRNLDIIAREPFWEAGLDYKHGTGHGVGYILNVHEGPNAFRWKASGEDAVLEEGMITTDEPGIYLEGRYGIRLENELLCRKGRKNEYGQFMYFENLTYVPFDLDAIVPEQMTEVERRRLNEYHMNVYRTVSPFLHGEELAWLKEATREI
ncbi:MAG: aminopeptidase P family protein [Agathobacter sp.]|nr:aminopeptidase P family protein [Agathobacter sp.]